MEEIRWWGMPSRLQPDTKPVPSDMVAVMVYVVTWNGRVIGVTASPREADAIDAGRKSIQGYEVFVPIESLNLP